jgi:hypothetical protein
VLCSFIEFSDGSLLVSDSQHLLINKQEQLPAKILKLAMKQQLLPV